MNAKYVRDFIRKSIKGGTVAAFNKNFESNQSEEILNNIKEYLKRNDNEFSNILVEFLKHTNIKREEIKLEFENGGKDQRTKRKEVDKFLDKN